MTEKARHEDVSQETHEGDEIVSTADVATSSCDQCEDNSGNKEALKHT